MFETLIVKTSLTNYNFYLQYKDLKVVSLLIDSAYKLVQEMNKLKNVL